MVMEEKDLFMKMENGRASTMKTNFLFGLAAFVLLGLVASCADPLMPVVIEEEQKQQPEAPKTVFFQASLEQVVDETKTALGSGLKVVWSAGDAIRIYSNSCQYGEVFTLKNGAGEQTGTFEGSASIGDGPYYAVYPNSEAVEVPNTYSSIESNNYFEVRVLPSHVYEANSFGNGSNISWAYSSSLSNLSFQNVFGAVKFSLTGTAKIQMINLYTRGSELLSGTLRVLNPKGPAPVSYSMIGTREEMTQYRQIFGMGEGVQLSGTPTDFYISVPAGALADGFFVEFIDTDGKAMIKSAPASSNVINRSKIRQMPPFAYAPQYKESFLKDYNDFAAYSGVIASSTSTVKECTYTEGDSQYSFLNTDSKRTVRFQDWSDGYSLSLEISPKTLTLNSTPAVTVTPQGATGAIVSQAGASMKVIKQTVERAWLYDSDKNQGYVIKLED